MLADYIGPHKSCGPPTIRTRTASYRAPQMLRERLGPLSPEAKHQVLAGGALGFYGMS